MNRTWEFSLPTLACHIKGKVTRKKKHISFEPFFSIKNRKEINSSSFENPFPLPNSMRIFLLILWDIEQKKCKSSNDGWDAAKKRTFTVSSINCDKTETGMTKH